MEGSTTTNFPSVASITAPRQEEAKDCRFDGRRVALDELLQQQQLYPRGFDVTSAIKNTPKQELLHTTTIPFTHDGSSTRQG